MHVQFCFLKSNRVYVGPSVRKKRAMTVSIRLTKGPSYLLFSSLDFTIV